MPCGYPPPCGAQRALTWARAGSGRNGRQGVDRFDLNAKGTGGFLPPRRLNISSAAPPVTQTGTDRGNQVRQKPIESRRRDRAPKPARQGRSGTVLRLSAVPWARPVFHGCFCPDTSFFKIKRSYHGRKIENHFPWRPERDRQEPHRLRVRRA